MTVSPLVAEIAPGYWMRWQTIVCALIVVLSAAAAVAVATRRRVGEPLRAADLYTSCWTGMHPAWLLTYRGLVFLAMAWLLSRTVLIRGIAAFYFYTQWTFALEIVYFMIATVISAHGCCLYSKTLLTQDVEANNFTKGGSEQSNSVTLPFRTNQNATTITLQSYHGEESNGRRAGFWGNAMQLIYQTSAAAVVLTDVTFWIVLMPNLSSEHFRLTLMMSYMHSLNAVFLLLDTFLNKLQFQWFCMAYFVLWSCIYVAFQWILHACGFSRWPYPFLELATPWAPLWYFLMTLAHVPCYGVCWLIVRAKNSLCPKFFPNSFVRALEH